MDSLRMKRIDWAGWVHECGGSGALFARFGVALTIFADEHDGLLLAENRATDVAVGPCVASWCVRHCRPVTMPRGKSYRSDIRNPFRHKLMRRGTGHKLRSADGLCLQ